MVDGHQRLGAYRLAGWKKKVPVKVFKGTFDEAREASVSANSKLNLNLTHKERQDVAWGRINDGAPRSQSQSMALAGVSRGQGTKMNKVKQAIKEAGRDPLMRRTWRDALDWMNRESQADVSDDWMDAAVEKDRQTLSKAFNNRAHGRADIFDKAVALFMGRRSGEVITGVLDVMDDDSIAALKEELAHWDEPEF